MHRLESRRTSSNPFGVGLKALKPKGLSWKGSKQVERRIPPQTLVWGPVVRDSQPPSSKLQPDVFLDTPARLWCSAGHAATIRGLNKYQYYGPIFLV